MNATGSTFYDGWIFKLIIINVIVYVIQIFSGGQYVTYSFQGMQSQGPSVFTHFFGLTPMLIVEKAYIWQIFSYMFLHSPNNFIHLFFNMYALLIFGAPIEQEWGGKKFLIYYLYCGTFAGVAIFLINLIGNGMGYIIPTIGASGAVFGILLAFGVLFPDMELLLFFVMPIKAKYLVFLYGGLELYFELSGSQSSVSHIGHLGGLAAGIIYFIILKRRTINFKVKLFKAKTRIAGKPGTASESAKGKMDKNNPETQIKILKKIKETGADSLTDDEIQYIKYIEIMMDEEEKVLCDENDLDAEDEHCQKCDNFSACFLRKIKEYFK